jgi:CHAT domain-containing protein
MLRRAAVAAILIVSLILAARATAAIPAHDAERVVAEFYLAYTQGNAADAAKHWVDSKRPSVFPALARTTRTRCFILDDLELSTQDGAVHATVSARATITSVSQYSSDRPRTRVIHETFVLQRSAGGTWKILSRRTPQEELATRLAKSDGAADAGLPPEADEWSQSDLVHALCRQAILLVNQQQYSRAAKLLAYARDRVQATDHAASSDIAGTESVLLRRSGASADAVKALVDESLSLARMSGDPDTIARALLRSGRAQQFADGATAITPFEEILSMAEFVQDASVLALAATQSAKVTGDAGDHRTSLVHSVAAETYARESGDDTALLSAHLNLAGGYVAQNDFETAIVHLEEAARLAAITGNTITAARIMADVAEIAGGSGVDARPIVTRSIEAIEEVPNASDARVELLSIRASMHIDRNDLSGAEADVQRAAAEVACSVSPAKAAEVATGMLVHLRVRQGRYGEAVAAAAHLRDSNPWMSATIGHALTALGRCDEAYAYLQAAIVDQEISRARTTSDRHHILFTTQTSRIYHRLIELYLRDGRVDEAFLTADRAKARGLRALSARHRHSQPFTPGERLRMQELERRIGTLNRALADVRGDAVRTASLRTQLRRVRADLNDFRARTISDDALFAAGSATPGFAALRNLGHALVLQYVVTDSNIILFAAEPAGSRQHRISAHVIPIPNAMLAARVDELSLALEQRDLRYPQFAASMFDLLLHPVRAAVRGSKTVHVLPDADLWRVPFHALRTNGKYLMENATISYALSLETASAGRPRPLSGAKLLAIGSGNPLELPEAPAAATRSASFEPIPEAEEEARAVAALYGDRGVIVIGRDANEALIERDADEYDILHIAAHGLTDDMDPMFSAVLLAPAPDGTEDGFLEAREIAGWNLKASVAILSACASGGGKVTAGEGVIGLSWALFVAGCPTAVVSLWDVNSAATRELMVLFHERLRGGDSPAAAMRHAQISLRRSKRYSHPFFWAPFVVIGAG